MSVDNRLKNNPHDDTIERRYRSRIAPQADFTDSPPVPDIAAGDTGGALHRAVGVRELPDHGFEVSICEFDTPGLYTKFKNGNIVGPDPARPYSLVLPVVRWTDEPAADGTTSTENDGSLPILELFCINPRPTSLPHVNRSNLSHSCKKCPIRLHRLHLQPSSPLLRN